jgi:hypothetical protein
VENSPFFGDISVENLWKTSENCGKFLASKNLWKTSPVFSTGFPQARSALNSLRARLLKSYPQFPQALLLLFKFKFKKTEYRLIRQKKHLFYNLLKIISRLRTTQT